MQATPFDPIKAQREVVAGLTDVFRVLQIESRAAQSTLSQAEARAHALMKLERFTADHLERERGKLHALLTAESK